MAEQMVEVGGRRLSVFTDGSGATCVILETGLGAPSEWWQDVQSRIASIATVWRYDRAGRGTSDPAPTPRSADDLVSDLHAVVEACDADRVVLVGNSVGGMIVRLYAHRHAGRIGGLVLVDASHGDQFQRIGGMLPPAAVLAPEAQEFHSFWAAGGWQDPDQNTEGIDFVSMQRATAAIDTLGDQPMVVLVAGQFMKLAPPPMDRVLHDAWLGMQSELAALSSRSSLVSVDDSGHFIQRDRPDVVADAIRSLIISG